MGVTDYFCHCICTDGIWCAVLGNFTPVEADAYGMIQRLCDQHNVEFSDISYRQPDCPECLKIRKFMTEFKRKPTKKGKANGSTG